MDGRVWEALHVAHALARSADFDLIHNHLDWLPLAFAGPVRGADGHHGPRLLLAADPARLLRSRSAFVSISDADRAAALRLRRHRLPRRRRRGAAVLRHARRRARRASAASTPTRGPPRRSRSPAPPGGGWCCAGWCRTSATSPRRSSRTSTATGCATSARSGPRSAPRCWARPPACCTRWPSPSRSGSRSSSRCCAARRSSRTRAGRCRRSSTRASRACSSTTSPAAVAGVERARALDRGACRQAARSSASRAERMVDDYLSVYESVLAWPIAQPSSPAIRATRCSRPSAGRTRSTR